MFRTMTIKNVMSYEHKELVSEIYASGGNVDVSPRCVWNKRNEILEEVFIKDAIILDLFVVFS